VSATLEAPPLLSSRRQARELLSSLPEQLQGGAVYLDCSELRSAAPSFIDEMIVTVLLERNADQLVFLGAPERAIEFACKAADVHAVRTRVVFAN
jgi:hypothetical protein